MQAFHSRFLWRKTGSCETKLIWNGKPGFKVRIIPTCFIVWDGLKVYKIDELCLMYANNLDSHMHASKRFNKNEQITFSNQVGNTTALVVTEMMDITHKTKNRTLIKQHYAVVYERRSVYQWVLCGVGSCG